MAEAVVLRPLLRIAQDAVCFRRFLELLFRFVLLAGITVRMPLQGKSAVGLLDLLDTGAARYTQDFVKIPFFC